MVNLRNPLAEQQQTQALLLHHKPSQIAIPHLRELMQGPLGRRQRPINAPQRHIPQFSNLAPSLNQPLPVWAEPSDQAAARDVTGVLSPLQQLALLALHQEER